MPTYDYECPGCSLRFEVKRHFAFASGASCPRCEGEARRVFCSVPVLFKGPGFYVTDNANGNSGASHKCRDEKPAAIEKDSAPPAKAKEVVAS